jgi:ubiquinone biosynthesis protein COQ9
MARASKSADTKPGGAATDRARVTDAVLAAASAGAWDEATIDSLALDTDLTRARVLRVLPCKQAALALIADYVDSAVLDEADREPIDIDGDPKDRLFDAMMRRFDVLQDHRDGIVALIRAAMRDPAAAACAAARAGRSMRLMLEVCGISADGPFGMLRVKGLALVYARTLRAWIDDDSPDMAKTMSTLDTALSRGARIMERLTPSRRRAAPAQPEEPEAEVSAS